MHDESWTNVKQNFDQSSTNVRWTKVGHHRCDGSVAARNAAIAMALRWCYCGIVAAACNDGATTLLL